MALNNNFIVCGFWFYGYGIQRGHRGESSFCTFWSFQLERLPRPNVPSWLRMSLWLRAGLISSSFTRKSSIWVGRAWGPHLKAGVWPVHATWLPHNMAASEEPDFLYGSWGLTAHIAVNKAEAELPFINPSSEVMQPHLPHILFF